MSKFIGGAIGHETIGGFVVPNWNISDEEEVNLFFMKVGFKSDKDYNACYPIDSDESEIMRRYKTDKYKYNDYYGGRNNGFYTIGYDFAHIEEISDWFYDEFRHDRVPMIYPRTHRFTEDYLDEDSEFWFWFCEDWDESLIDTMTTPIHKLPFYHDYISDNIYDDEDYDNDDDEIDDDELDEIDDDEYDDDEYDDDEYDEDGYDNANNDLDLE